MRVWCLVVTLLLVLSGTAGAGNRCEFDKDSSVMTLKERDVRVVASLKNPPQTKVMLSIDRKDPPAHVEIVWDPAVNDGLQHSVLLSGTGPWQLTPSISEERVQSAQVIVLIKTFLTGALHGTDGIAYSAERKGQILTAQATVYPLDTTDAALIVECQPGSVDMTKLTLDPRRAEAASTARSFLEQPVPGALSEVLSIVAEIAVDRGKSAVMKIIHNKWIVPACKDLTLSVLKLGDEGLLLPRTCSLLDNTRLTDILSAGKSMLSALKDDVRLTVLPALVTHLGLGPHMQDIAALLLSLTNRIIDGESDQVAAIDFIVAMLDRSLLPDIGSASKAVVEAFLGDVAKNDIESLAESIVNAQFPENVDAAFDAGQQQKLGWVSVEDCRRHHTFMRWYYPARSEECAAAVAGVLKVCFEKSTSAERFACAAKLLGEDEFLYGTWKVIQTSKDGVVQKFMRKAADPAEATKLLPSSSIEYFCAGRLVLAIVKWCSAKDRCSADEIANIVSKPSTTFIKPELLTLDSLCWVGPEFRSIPNATHYVELATRLVSFLTPAGKGEERSRTLAIIHWVLDFVQEVNPRKDLHRRLSQIQEVVEQLIERDYMRAFAAALVLAGDLSCLSKETCEKPVALRKAIEIVGVVASYMATYDETKSLDPVEARAARKKALESLIDSVTDRHERGGDWIFSLGVPVGFAIGMTGTPGSDSGYSTRWSDYDYDSDFRLRIPLALAYQRLPASTCCGLHAAVWVADLGQYIHSDPDADIRWNDFLGVALQLGVLFGQSDRVFLVAAEASWLPGRFSHYEVIGDNPMPVHVQGAFNFGLTFAYYVSLFDFN